MRTEKPPRKPVARDLMDEVMVTVPQHMSLRGAARLLARAEASAAPVIDAKGRCVGDLAAAAFVPLVACGPGTRAGAFHECAWSDWQVLDEGAGRDGEVCEYMGVAPPLVGPETPLTDIVRVMADENACRVIVVDAEDVPLGTVSAARVLAELVRDGQPRPTREHGPAAGLPAPVGFRRPKAPTLARRRREFW